MHIVHTIQSSSSGQNSIIRQKLQQTHYYYKILLQENLDLMINFDFFLT